MLHRQFSNISTKFVRHCFRPQTSAASALAQQFHPKFLRENTWEAWDESSRQRLDFNLGTDVAVEEVSPILGEASLPQQFRVHFSDGHVGLFEPPLEAERVWNRDLPKWPYTFWGSCKDSLDHVQKELLDGGALRFNFDALQQDDVAHKWAESLHVYGITVVDGMPIEENTIIEFANNMTGYVYPTVYGHKFTIKAVDDPNNLAYSNLGLQMHTDLPFYSTPPAIQLFHCLKQAEEGGESLFLDGFDAALALQQEDPDAFQVLCEHQVRFQDLTSRWHLSARHPTFSFECESSTSSHGERRLRRVCFNERSRDSWRDWTENKIEAQTCVYDALAAYERIVEQRERYVNMTLRPGEMVCIDNWRLMHSRGGFKGARHFEGAYIDWDALYARWRATKEAAGLSPPEFPSRP